MSIKRPRRLFSFTDHAIAQPKAPPPGDRLDAQFAELLDALVQTQEALAEIRRDDGRIRNATVSIEQLSSEVQQRLAPIVNDRFLELQTATEQAAARAVHSEANTGLFAKDAESAAIAAAQFLSAIAGLREHVDRVNGTITQRSAAAEFEAMEAENWGTYSKAQADNSIAAKNESLQWAEYLAGPVVDATKAPAYIAASPFPQGLYYQPVEGGVAGLWSAKWWALQAYNWVGAVNLYFLGGWPSPPLPGEVNPDTGQQVPNPILPGSIYYDETTGEIKFWNGLDWVSPSAVVGGASTGFVYLAIAGQTVFTGADSNGHTPIVGSKPSDVHVNGVRLVPTLDYAIAGDVLTIAAPMIAGSVVQWDLLSEVTADASLTAHKMQPLDPDGVLQDFILEYLDGGSPIAADVGSSAELMVSLDGAMQEPGVDFSATGSVLHMAQPPVETARLWAVWFKPEAA